MGANDDPAMKRPGPSPLPTPDLNELREILLGENWRKLNALEDEILDDAKFSRRVAEVLPESLRVANSTPVRLVGALQDPTIESISIAARNEQQRLSEALAPVIGPSIQQAIVQALQKFTQSIETIAEHNFSVKGLKWRMESARTGVPFHQVILKHTLKYEVEQVYLIQKPSGQLVRHLMHPDLAEQQVDRDAIAGMMMAIQDFVRDSAFAETSETVQTIDLRGKTVWMCHGAWGLLACVIEGRPPQSLRDEMKAVLDGIHGQFQHPLREFNGDLEPLAGIELPLQPLLRKEMIDGDREAEKSKGKPLWLTLLAAAILGFVIYTLYAAYESHAQRTRLIQELSKTAGVVVTKMDHKDGVWHVRGLADPLGFDANAVAANAAIGSKQIRFEFSPYVSLDPTLILRRAIIALQPPKSVTLQLRDRVLAAQGTADAPWVARLANTSAALLNVERVDVSALIVDHSAALNTFAEKLRASELIFTEGIELTRESEAALPQLAEMIKRIIELASENRRTVQVILTGNADASGSAVLNESLKFDRANAIKDHLIALGVTDSIVAARSAPKGNVVQDRNNRRVVLSLEISPRSN